MTPDRPEELTGRRRRRAAGNGVHDDDGAAAVLGEARHGAASRDARRGRLPLSILAPLVVLLLSLAAWVAAATRSGFWADDFVNLSLYDHTLGDLTDLHRNDGKYTINVFWWLGTEAFGTASVLPFILTVSMVMVLGTWLWLWAGVGRWWTAVQAWWIAAVLAATTTPFGIMLWSSNIVHAASFLALGVGLLAHVRSQESETRRGAAAWSCVGAAAWLVLVVSNPLYIGLVILGGYLVILQSRGWMSRLGRDQRQARITTGVALLAHVGLPLLYFVAIAYPMTTSRKSYSSFGFAEIGDNIRFYRDQLAPTTSALVVYAVILLAGLFVAVWRLRHDLLPIVLVASAGAVGMPVLMQGQQRAAHYLAMPILLTLNALAAGLGPRAARPSFARASWFRGAVVTAAVVGLAVIFGAASPLRSWWVAAPLGTPLIAARQEIADRTPSGSALCVELDFDEALRPGFVAAMGGPAGALFAPIYASSVRYLGPGECAGAVGPVVTITNDGGIYDAVVEGAGS